MSKQLAALGAAWFFGAWVGIRWTANTIIRQLELLVQPAWVGEVSRMEGLAVVGLFVCVAGWILLDRIEVTRKRNS